jgi:hypothetical protein
VAYEDNGRACAFRDGGKPLHQRTDAARAVHIRAAHIRLQWVKDKQLRACADD